MAGSSEGVVVTHFSYLPVCFAFVGCFGFFLVRFCFSSESFTDDVSFMR